MTFERPINGTVSLTISISVPVRSLQRMFQLCAVEGFTEDEAVQAFSKAAAHAAIDMLPPTEGPMSEWRRGLYAILDRDFDFENECKKQEA